MTNIQDPLLMDHDADGIRELDNKLPRWWVWMFYGSIVFAVVYMGYFHVLHLGDLQVAQYKKDWAAGEKIKQVAMQEFEAKMGTLTPAKDLAIIGQGQVIFLKNCSPCHRKDGGGLVGPNLCDDYWIHGSNFVDNVRTIMNGVPNKGMLTWKGVLTPSQIYHVASYIYTLRGSNPKNPKPPENLQQAAAPNVYE